MTFPAFPARRATIGTIALLALLAALGACGERTPLFLGGDVVTPSDEDGGILPSDSGIQPVDVAQPVDAALDTVAVLDAPELPPPDASEDVAPDVTEVATPPPDFVWYRLDETSGTTAHDSSPNHYDITNLTGVAWNQGAVFDGATVCGSTEVGAAFRTAPVTMTVWLTADDRDDETSTNHALTPFPPNAFSGDAPSLGGFAIGGNVWTDGTPGNGMALETGEDAAIAFDSIPGIDAGTEYLAALVIGPFTADFFVNGALWATVQADTPYAETPAPLHLGCHNDDTGYLTKRFFKGRLRDARIYTRLLEVDEIAQLYANGPA
jgi:predicted small lipoprotein YifL